MGGIGGLLAAALARAGATCVVLLRPETLAGYPGRITVESAVLGDFEVDVPAAPALEREIDVLWIATKATQLDDALALAPAERVDGATVIPLLNGVDHVALLRERYSHRRRRCDTGRVGTHSSGTHPPAVAVPPRRAGRRGAGCRRTA